jgi:mRNA interferase RelE/StbE
MATPPVAYEVRLSKAAARELRKLSPPLQDRLLQAVTNLQSAPRPASCVKLSGSDNLYRVRTGDYRIIYKIEDDVLLVLVVRIAHRREAYRDR